MKRIALPSSRSRKMRHQQLSNKIRSLSSPLSSLQNDRTAQAMCDFAVAAEKVTPSNALFVDYSNLPDAVPEFVFPEHFGVAAEIAEVCVVCVCVWGGVGWLLCLHVGRREMCVCVCVYVCVCVCVVRVFLFGIDRATRLTNKKTSVVAGRVKNATRFLIGMCVCVCMFLARPSPPAFHFVHAWKHRISAEDWVACVTYRMVDSAPRGKDAVNAATSFYPVARQCTPALS